MKGKVQIPLTIATMLFSNVNHSPLWISSATAATLDFVGVQESQTSVTEHLLASTSGQKKFEESGGISNTIDLVEMANRLLSDSRPMTEWEREATDKFFWS